MTTQPRQARLAREIRTLIDPFLRPCGYRAASGRPLRVYVFAEAVSGDQYLGLPQALGLTEDGVITDVHGGRFTVVRFEEMLTDDLQRLCSLAVGMPAGG